jgi:hypothetical protein
MCMCKIVNTKIYPKEKVQTAVRKSCDGYVTAHTESSTPSLSNASFGPRSVGRRKRLLRGYQLVDPQWYGTVLEAL